MKLSNVTLCTVTSDMIDLTERAMRICQKDIEFSESVFVTDAEVSDNPDWRTYRVKDMGDLNGYNRFVSKNLPKYCNTDFLLLVQWDGYVLDPGAWDDEFLEYDYIGAVWPWLADHQKVGNGGFCIRSKRFMETVSQMPYPPADVFYSDDVYPCQVWRKELDGMGLKFAPIHLANKFAYERGFPTAPTFGFHGQFTMWQHVSDDDMIAMVSGFNARQAHRIDYKELMANYATQGRFRVFKALYDRLMAVDIYVDLEEYFLPFKGNPLYAKLLILCEYYRARR